MPGDGKTLDLELLLNQIGGIFKPDEEASEDDDTLQAAISAQVRKTNFEHRGAIANDRTGPKKSQESRSPKVEFSDLTNSQVFFNMKAEMGIMRRAMTNA